MGCCGEGACGAVGREHVVLWEGACGAALLAAYLELAFAFLRVEMFSV